MVRSDQSPSLLRPGDDQAVYLVLDDFGGRIGQVWRETNVEATDLETVIEDLLDDQFSKPVKIAGFNTAEGWSRDVSEDIANELRRRCYLRSREIPDSVLDFIKRHGSGDREVQLLLPIRF